MDPRPPRAGRPNGASRSAIRPDPREAEPATEPITFAFAGGPIGEWFVDRADTMRGAPLARTARLAVTDGTMPVPADAAWILRGVTSHLRYATAREARRLAGRSPRLGRPEATCAALIAIRKSPGWWRLAQDERRAIIEPRSRHVAVGLEYLPAVARRLHHGRDLGEPFDFLTWFEFAPADAHRFDELVARLRASDEWAYVDREVDIRVTRR